MQRFRNKLSGLSMIFMLLLAGGTLLGACGGRQVAQTPPSCSEVLAGDLYAVSDLELIRLLDGALNETGGKTDCWAPLMKQALREDRYIPPVHLKEAIKYFNHNRNAEVFHLAVAAYFRALQRGEGDYRPLDRDLLRSYCSLLLAESKSSSDARLKQTMSLCRSLDPQLYNRIFQ